MFAALSYAIMDGSRNSAATLSDDQAKLAAQEMIAFSDSVAKAVQAMKLRGIAETNLDFANTTFLRRDGTQITTANPNCTSNDCKVFDISGGKVTPITMPEIVKIDQSALPMNEWRSGSAGFRVLQIAGVGTSSPDLTITFTYIQKAVCMKINEIMGITNPANDAPFDHIGTFAAYSANTTPFPNPAGFGIGDTAPELTGKTMFCAKGGGDYYHTYSVLLAR